MLPYFPQPSWHLFGPVTIHAFGIMAAADVFFAVKWGAKRCRDAGFQSKMADDLLAEVGLPAVLGGHVFDTVFYHPDRLMSDGPLFLLKFWDGMSSVGGLLSIFFFFYIFVRRHQQQKNWVSLLDISIQGLLVGQIFGRAGCSLAHDHPGSLTDFPLAFDFPGGARHDLGFYEFLFVAFALFPASLWIHKKKPRPGTQFAALTSLYGFVRFFLDSLRATDITDADARYLGLTPGQYVSLALVAFGVFRLFQIYPEFKEKLRSAFQALPRIPYYAKAVGAVLLILLAFRTDSLIHPAQQAHGFTLRPEVAAEIQANQATRKPASAMRHNKNPQKRPSKKSQAEPAGSKGKSSSQDLPGN